MPEVRCPLSEKSNASGRGVLTRSAGLRVAGRHAAIAAAHVTAQRNEVIRITASGSAAGRSVATR